MTKSKFAFLLGLAVPAFFAFKPLLFPGPVVWGDAPYFYPEAFREFVVGPFAWINFGNNFGGPNSLIWIYPIMLLYGWLHVLLGLDNDIIIRLLFYFPGVLLAFISPVFFVRYLGYSRIVQFFASLVYALNTYFLLVVDGGQVGVTLAYGLFPFTLLSLHYLVAKPGFTRFWVALLTLFLLIIADLRFAAISLIALLFWIFTERLAQRSLKGIGNLYLLLPVLLGAAGLSGYWLAPFLQAWGVSGLTADVSGLNLASLINPLFLFQPHWPANIFGQVSPPPFYFAVVPLLVFGCLFWKRERAPWIFAFLILIFVFLTKGETPPLGGLYGWVMTSVPFGSAFRDSTKFFTPLILFSGILVGFTIKSVGKHGPSRVVLLTAYAYLLFLLHPAFTGGLNGVLAGRSFPQDFSIIYQNLAREDGFLRTLWFPERSPFAFQTEEKPALDAKGLVKERPFASLNVGTFDAFNFLQNKEASQWFDILGIKYLILSGDPRKASLSEGEQRDWDSLLSLVGASGLEKVEWGVNIPIYRVAEAKPRIFATNKLVAVVGADDIYEKLEEEDDKFSIGNQGFVFFEDGKFNPKGLDVVSPGSVLLVLNGKEELDLIMSFLQKYFVAPKESVVSEWAIRGTNDYLRYKYELLINSIEIKEFDYGKGIAFSSIKGEKISWGLPIPADGDYILAVRKLGNENIFSWDIADIHLTKGVYPLTLTNSMGLEVVNVVALIPKDAWIEAQSLSQELIRKFDVVSLESGLKVVELADLLAKSRWQEVSYEMVSPARYKINIPEGVGWLVFSDSYNRDWILDRGTVNLPTYPFYSMINGFHPRPEWRQAEIVFKGQRNVRWGFYWSLISFFLLLIVFLWLYSKRREWK